VAIGVAVAAAVEQLSTSLAGARLFHRARQPLCQGVPGQIDNPFVSRLREAGGIVIGKTTVSMFGWTTVSRSPLTGITHSPWKKDYTAGASPAGAGAAAAAEYSALHQGGDGAGSISMAAHFCGLFGLKPTRGRVPNHPKGAGDYTSHWGR